MDFVADVLASEGNQEAKNLLIRLGLSNEGFQGAGIYAIRYVRNGRTNTVLRFFKTDEEIDRFLTTYAGSGYGILKVTFKGHAHE